MKDRDDIEKRYEQYRCHELPGQPMGAHMGTNYLINDLHKALVETEAECDRLLDVLRGIENTPPSNIQGQVATPESWWKRLVEMRDQARAALQEALQEADDE